MTGKEFLERNPAYFFDIDNDAEEIQLICMLNDDSDAIVKTFAFKDFIYPNCSPEHLIDGLLLEIKNAESTEAIHNIAKVIARIKQDAKS